ncbi:hypothetical protein [Chitinophaga sp. Cy-1792]|uniref:hypothetical protein n=1 Tax=Chitinophaga sp. Cy-1792 TaxID=2608339 RepID=UPI00142476A3|nr:hypothetical protein [Chitinophaga sp. Cy-1792]NIG53901.1 hypothetical protein [Chitinophaga sp. Cy-1792]
MQIATFDKCVNEIKQNGNLPIVLEALWDGDTNGWYLYLRLYAERKTFLNKKLEHYDLGVVSLGNDARLFTGEEPAWPEATLAKALGKHANEKYGITFYFPSPDEPDDDCPSWTQRHLAINCADCNKLIIPTTSPYLSKDACYNCHLRRESNDKLRKAAPCNEGFHLYISDGNNEERNAYSTNFEGLSLAPYIQHLVDIKNPSDVINIIIIPTAGLPEIIGKLEESLEHHLSNFSEAPEQKLSGYARHVTIANYKGKSYRLLNHPMYRPHYEISDLIDTLEELNQTYASNKHFKVIFKNGINSRDDSILRFIYYVSKGSATISDIEKRYTGVLSTEEITSTLHKLQSLQCVEIIDNTVSILQKGRYII